MAAMAPANAARISVSEPVSRPRFKKTTIVSATASLAPLEMPMTKGPAIGLAKNVCSRYPATESAAPSSTTMTARGRRSCEQDVGRQRVCAAAQQGRGDVRRGERNAAPEQVERKQRQQGRRHGEVCNCHALEVCMRGFPLRRAAMVRADMESTLRMRHGFVRPFLPPR